MRGEKNGRMNCFEATEGSSPLARGKASKAPEIIKQLGIIPACAGKSDKLLKGINVCEDHPRLRGEKGGEVSIAVNLWGSSPLARGKVLLDMA